RPESPAQPPSFSFRHPVELAHSVIDRVGHEQVAGEIDGDPFWSAELRAAGVPTITRESALACSGQRLDLARWRHLTYPVVSGVGYEQGAVAGDRHSERKAEVC